jgi:hypothetical protein
MHKNLACALYCYKMGLKFFIFIFTLVDSILIFYGIFLELQSSGPSHIAFLINLGLNNYSKATNVDRYKPREFYRLSKLANFWAFWHIWSF